MSESGEVVFHLIELGDTGRRRDHEHYEGASLPALGVPDQVGPLRRGLRERLHVPHHVVGRRDLFAEVVPDDLLQRRYVRVVLGRQGTSSWLTAGTCRVASKTRVPSIMDSG